LTAIGVRANKIVRGRYAVSTEETEVDQRLTVARHIKGAVFLPLALLACSAARKYPPISISNIIAGRFPAGNVEIRGYARVTGNMLGVYPDYPNREMVLNSECVAGIATKGQIKKLSGYDKTAPIRFIGSVVANPDFVSEDKLYYVKVSGRTWYGSFCSAKSAIFISAIAR
jgi:hypothetical protein